MIFLAVRALYNEVRILVRNVYTILDINNEYLCMYPMG